MDNRDYVRIEATISRRNNDRVISETFGFYVQKDKVRKQVMRDAVMGAMAKYEGVQPLYGVGAYDFDISLNVFGNSFDERENWHHLAQYQTRMRTTGLEQEIDRFLGKKALGKVTGVKEHATQLLPFELTHIDPSLQGMWNPTFELNGNKLQASYKDRGYDLLAREYVNNSGLDLQSQYLTEEERQRALRINLEDTRNLGQKYEEKAQLYIYLKRKYGEDVSGLMPGYGPAIPDTLEQLDKEIKNMSRALYEERKKAEVAKVIEPKEHIKMPGKPIDNYLEMVDDEHHFIHLENVLYGYNSGEFPEQMMGVKQVGIHSLEDEFLEKQATLLEKHGIIVPESPEGRASAIHGLRLELARQSNQEEEKGLIQRMQDLVTKSNQDAYKMRALRDVIQQADEGKIHEQMAQSQFGFIREIAGHAQKQGATTDQDMLYWTKTFLQTSQEMHSKVGLNNAGFLPGDISSPKAMVEKLNRQIGAMYRDDGVDSYSNYREARTFIRDYNNMIQSMYDARREYGIEFKESLIKDEADLSAASWEMEKESAHKRDTAVSRLMEANDEYYDRHKTAVLSANDLTDATSWSQLESRPKQPINVIRNAIIEQLVEPNQEVSKALSEQIERFLMGNGVKLEGLTAEGYKTLREMWGLEGGTVEELEDALARANESKLGSIISYKPVGYDTKNDAVWRSAADRNEQVRIAGDIVPHTVRGFEGGVVKLEAAHVLPGDITLHQPIDPAEIATVIETVNDQKRRSQLSNEEMMQKARNVIDQNIIEVVYKQEWVKEDLKETNERLYRKLADVQGKFKEAAETVNIRTDGTIERRLDVRNIVEQYHSFMPTLSDMEVKTGVDRKITHRLPAFLQEAIQSHASWMQGVDNVDELVSTAYIGFRDALDRLGKEQTTLDLTDEGFKKLWERMGKSEDEISTLAQRLQGKSLRERLDERLFLDTMAGIHRAWFEMEGKAPGSQQSAIDSLVYQIHDVISDQMKITPRTGADSGLDQFDEAASRIRSTIQGARKTIEMFPWYSELLKLNQEQIDDILARRGQENVSWEEWLSRLANQEERRLEGELRGYEKDLSVDERISRKQTEQALGLAYDEKVPGVTQEVVTGLVDSYDKDGNPIQIPVTEERPVTVRDLFKDVLEGKVTLQEKLADPKAAGALIQKMQNLTPKTVHDIDFMLDVAKAMNQDSIQATINYDGKAQPATIYRGNSGGILADLPESGTTVKIFSNSKEAVSRHRGDTLKFQKMYGGDTLEDIVSGGELKRESFGVFDELQMRGTHRTVANPTETADLIKDFQSGDMKITYLDMETTGVSNSMLPKQMLQPIEISMRQAQWDPTKNDYLRDASGEIGILGEEFDVEKRQQQFFIKLGHKQKKYMEQIIEKENFKMWLPQEALDAIQASGIKLKTDNNVLSIIQYNNLSRSDQQAVQNALYQFDYGRVLGKKLEKKSSRLWFLRNIAKYGDNQDNFDEHAGNKKIRGHKAYLSRLIEDARTGFEFINEEGVDRRTFINQVTDFVKETDAIAGQNVAEADWAKVQQAIQDEVKVIDSIIDTERYWIDRSKTGEKPIEYLQSNIDSFYRSIGESMGLPQLNMLERVREKVNSWRNDEGVFIINEDIQERSRVTQLARDAGVLEEIQRHLNSGGSLSENMIDQLVEIETRHGTEEALEKLGGHIFDVGTSIRGHEEVIKRFEGEKASLRLLLDQKPRAIEQMYAFKMVNPDARSASAEVQNKLAKTASTGLMHSAEADVDMGLETLGTWMKSLFQNSEFQAYDGQSLGAGDIIRYHTQTQDHIPEGVYEVSHVDNVAHKIVMRSASDPNQTEYTFYAPSQNELSRRYHNSFSFVAGSEDEQRQEKLREALTNYNDDAARRTVQRATDSAFTFDVHQARREGQSGLAAMRDLYQGIADGAVPQNNIERTALLNASMFESNQANNLLNQILNPHQAAAFSVMGELGDSLEWQARKDMMYDLRAMEASGAMTGDEAKELLRSMNERIKAEGVSRGFRRKVPNVAQLSVLDESFGPLKGRTLTVDMTNANTIRGSMWRNANMFLKRAEWELQKEGKPITDNSIKAHALNRILIPHLRDQGVISSKGDITLSQLVNEIAAKPMLPAEEIEAKGITGALPQYEEYDHLAYRTMTPEQAESFADYIRTEYAREIEPYKAQMTGLQTLKFEAFNQTVSELQEAGVYDPRLKITPRINDIKTEAIQMGRFGGFENFTASELRSVADLMTTDNALEVDTRNAIFNELFQRATSGRYGSTEGLPTVDAAGNIIGGDPARLEAMEALNWVKTNKSGGYMMNPAFEDYYFGAQYGKYGTYFSGKQFKELPLDMVTGIVDNPFGNYTEGRGSGETLVRGFLEQWKKSGLQNRNKTAPNQIPEINVVYKDRKGDIATAEQVTQVYQDTYDEGVRRRMKNEGMHQQGIEKAMTDAGYTKTYQETLLEQTKKPLPDGWVRTQYNEAREAVSNMATDFMGTGLGKAMPWVAGFGVAALALRAMTAGGDPLKFERRPSGHGVAGVAGQENDDKRENVKPNPQTGSTTYVTTEDSQGRKGYKIRATGTDNRGIDYEAAMAEIQKNLGDVNLNLRDDRTSLNRKWLEDQFSSYIERGHA